MAKVLIIDDDELMRAMLVDYLTAMGHEVSDAADGRIAIRLLAERPVDVIITDIIMPNSEGLETIMAIRRQQRGAKIIAISGGGASGSRDYLTMAADLGAHRTFQKPFDLKAVAAAVAELAG